MGFVIRGIHLGDEHFRQSPLDQDELPFVMDESENGRLKVDARLTELMMAWKARWRSILDWKITVDENGEAEEE